MDASVLKVDLYQCVTLNNCDVGSFMDLLVVLSLFKLCRVRTFFNYLKRLLKRADMLGYWFKMIRVDLRTLQYSSGDLSFPICFFTVHSEYDNFLSSLDMRTISVGEIVYCQQRHQCQKFKGVMGL